MGRTLIEAVGQAPGMAVAGGSERPGTDLIGRDVGAIAGLEPIGIEALIGD